MGFKAARELPFKVFRVAGQSAGRIIPFRKDKRCEVLIAIWPALASLTAKPRQGEVAKNCSDLRGMFAYWRTLCYTCTIAIFSVNLLIHRG
jgi:hypothetical protein